MPDGGHFTLHFFDRREAARKYAIDYAFRSDALQVFDTATREEIYRSRLRCGDMECYMLVDARVVFFDQGIGTFVLVH
jgi:hypothetical protein